MEPEMNAKELRKHEVRNAIISMLPTSADTIKKTITESFNIQNAAVNKHLRSMVDEGLIKPHDKSKNNRSYSVKSKRVFSKKYTITESLAEDLVWRDDVEPLLVGVTDNAREIWNHGFTEMFNNAIDHSNGTQIEVTVEKYFNGYTIYVQDNGVGIFGKIKREFGLHDERQALLELSKGKLTTDPDRHSGEGIFFTSRAIDKFLIVADGIFFCHRHDHELDLIDDSDINRPGTLVIMSLNSQTGKELSKIFNEFAPADEFTFSKTVVPIHLAQYKKDFLVSRSQAKRVLARVENFKIVVFDFEGVENIGQAFADEIFRVFQNKYPDIKLLAVSTTTKIDAMIERAKALNKEKNLGYQESSRDSG
jgi:anti-sigma regulatory factor (Ser/Thr protein kinase)